MGDGHAIYAQSPIPHSSTPAESPHARTAADAKSPAPATSPRPHHLRGRFAAAAIAVVTVTGAFAINAAPALAAPPVLTTGEATDLSLTSATLTGTVNPQGVALTECDFEYLPASTFNANAANEVQTVTLTGATGGTFTLVFKSQTTTTIAFNAPASGAGSVQEALEALSTIGAGNLEVTGSQGGPYTIEFKAALARTDVPQLTADSSALTGATAAPATTNEGDDGYSSGATVAPCKEPEATQVGSGTEPVPVHAKIEGLTPDADYHFRLALVNLTPETAKGSDRVFTTRISHSFSTSFSGPATAPLTYPTNIEVDQSTADVYVANSASNQQQAVTVAATGGTFTLTFEGQTTAAIPYNAPAGGAGSVESALGNLSSVHANQFEANVHVTGPAGGPYAVEFTDHLGGLKQPPLTVDATGLTGPAASATTALTVIGGRGGEVEKFTASGTFLLMFGKEVNKQSVEEGGTEAEQNLCAAQPGEAEPGERCQPAYQASTPGAFETTHPGDTLFENSVGLFLAVDNSTGPSAGDLYVGDPGDNLISKFDSEGHLITGWGNGGRIDGAVGRGGLFSIADGLKGIAVNPTDGDLFAAADFPILYEYEPNGSWLAGADSGEPYTKGNGGIAVEGAGNVFDFASTESSQVWVYPGLSPGQYSYGLQGRRGLGAEAGSGLAFDPATRDLYVDRGESVLHYPASCVTSGEACAAPLDTFGTGELHGAGGLAIDSSTGAVYVADTGAHRVAVFSALPYLPDPTAAASPKTPSSESLHGRVDPAGAGSVTGCQFEYVPTHATQTLTLSGATGGTFTLTLSVIEPTSTFTVNPTNPIPFNTGAEGLELALHAPATHARTSVSVTGPTGGPFSIEFTGPPGRFTTASSGLTPSGATATIADHPGGHWTTATTTSCQPPLPYSETEPTAVAAEATALTPGTAYDFRLAAEDDNGSNAGYLQEFTTLPEAPKVESDSVGSVFAETARIHAQIDPGGGETTYQTTYRAQFLTAEQYEHNDLQGEGEFANAELSPSLEVGPAGSERNVTAPLTGLAPDTTYHYRVLASNECEVAKQCVAAGQGHTFTTMPIAIDPTDPCSNAHVRQQTSAAQLLDCRAYEFVSAPHTAGYNVESNLIEAQTPFAGYPEAQGRVLYGIHDGGVPGVGEPTEHGVDPYLATRTESGWSTSYVGLPASGIPSTAPYGSPLLEADPGLDAFAFGGAGLCSPCFGSGIETGIPLRSQSGQLVQGMAPQDPETEAAKPDGFIAQRFSSDGEHFVFGSTSKFAEGGNEEAEENVSIYDRDLSSGETHLVSDTPGGENEPLPCLQGAKKCHSSEHPSKNNPNGIAELGISSDGSHILIAQKVSEDADHNVYWHLYMNVGDSNHTIDLTPQVISAFGGLGLKEGVLFAGMTADGSRVFFTTADKLLPEDTDESPDLYMWSQQGEEEGHPLTLLSTGPSGPSNSDACEPVANANGEHWNSLSATPNCGALAIGGGGGVATESGDIYFLSPELLAEPMCGITCAGKGCGITCEEGPTKNQPNLYLAAPGLPPRFIATLEPENLLVIDSLKESGTRHTADFQATPSGRFVAFPSTVALAGNGEETGGHSEIYRYDAADEDLACASCTLTGLSSAGDSSLASDGLSLASDGRVFFNSTAPLVASDTDERPDVYEWEQQGTGNCTTSGFAYSKSHDSCLALISAGTSSSDSSLLSADVNGTDVYFFTRDSLAPQDENGPTVKIYDAREGGGFPYTPPEVTCKASDECHGAASSPPPPIEAGSEAGTPHNFKEGPKCKRGFALKHGHCVKPHKHKHHRRGGASKQSKSDSPAQRAKTKHLQRANRKRGGKK